jgi:hypothetical protein
VRLLLPLITRARSFLSTSDQLATTRAAALSLLVNNSTSAAAAAAGGCGCGCGRGSGGGSSSRTSGGAIASVEVGAVHSVALTGNRVFIYLFVSQLVFLGVLAFCMTMPETDKTNDKTIQ